MASTMDLVRAWVLSQLPAGADTNPSTVTAGGSESVGAAGALTAPTAGTAVATITNPPAGLYEVTIQAHTPTAGAGVGDDNNLELRVAAVVKTKVGLSRSQNVVLNTCARVRVTGSQAITVNATGAATAAVIYAVNMTARKVSD